MSSWNYRSITSNYLWRLGLRTTGQGIAGGGLGIPAVGSGAPGPNCHPHRITVWLPVSCCYFLGTSFSLWVVCPLYR